MMATKMNIFSIMATKESKKKRKKHKGMLNIKTEFRVFHLLCQNPRELSE